MAQSFATTSSKRWWQEFQELIKCMDHYNHKLQRAQWKHKYNGIPAFDNDVSMRTLLSICKWPLITPYIMRDLTSQDSAQPMNNNHNPNNKYNYFTALSDLLKLAIEWYAFDFEWAVIPRYMSTFDGWDEISAFYKPKRNTGSSEYTLKFITDCRGYQGITLALASTFLNHSYYTDDATGCRKMIRIEEQERLKLNSVVYKIDYKSNKYVYVYARDRLNAKSTTRYTAKHVMLTVSLGVYQSNLIEFVPTLPFWKRRALYEFPMVDYLPVYSQFPCPFWEGAHKCDGYNMSSYDSGHVGEEVVVLDNVTMAIGTAYDNASLLFPGMCVCVRVLCVRHTYTTVSMVYVCRLSAWQHDMGIELEPGAMEREQCEHVAAQQHIEMGRDRRIGASVCISKC